MSERFGRLTLIQKLNKRTADKHILGLWQCDCGAMKEIALSRVRKGYIQSCGCLAIDVTRIIKTKHGMRHTPEYCSWTAMKDRCHNPRSKDFYRYGALGITVCEEWQKSFDAFFAHIGLRPKGKLSVDRIDPNKGYEPNNVRWATAAEQSYNRRDLTVVNTPLGVMPLVDYARHLGSSRGAAHLRLKRGKLEGCCHV